MYPYSEISLLGSGNRNDVSYKSHLTSMVGKRERNTSHGIQKASTFDNWKNQFLQSYIYKQAAETKNSQPRRTELRSNDNWKNQFLQSYIYKHATETKNSQPRRTELRSNGNSENQFLQSYINKHAAKAVKSQPQRD